MSRFLSRAGERIAELADLSADEGRLARGRALYRKGSVSDLVIAEGSITASVRGSQGDLYQATISTAPAPPGVRRQVLDGSDRGRRVDELIDDGIDVCPREIDLAFGCDCADWDEPCKHVVAAVLALADRVDLDEAPLLRWRGLDPSTAEPGGGTGESETPSRTAAPPSRRAQPRSTAGTGPDEAGPGQTGPGETGPDETASDETGDRAATLSRLESLLGDTVLRVPADGDREPGPPPVSLDPALAAFLGVGQELEPVDIGDLAAVAPLFTSVEFGPLADLGPQLAAALAMIADRLADPTPER